MADSCCWLSFDFTITIISCTVDLQHPTRLDVATMSNSRRNDISHYFGESAGEKRPRPKTELSVRKELNDETNKRTNDDSVDRTQLQQEPPLRNKKNAKAEMDGIDKNDTEKTQIKSCDQPLEDTTIPAAVSSNPFAQFAYAPPKDASVTFTTSKDTSKLTSWKIFSSQHLQPPPSSAPLPKKLRSTSRSSIDVKKKQKKDAFVRMKDLDVEEQKKITNKWHSLADRTAPLEVRRYQVLLAARLHARCQEPTVRKAMQMLRDAMPEGVTVESMASADPEVLATCISNLQFYNVKAQQVVKAAQEIQSRFGGKVPEDEWSLSQITGIGKCFADLLAFVNTRQKHEEVPNENEV